ncbi:MAG: ribonucleotide reductase [Rhodospirillaceae bacterium]|nr:ribonucleotide reductase [Rhodospirillaceae bacterium]
MSRWHLPNRRPNTTLTLHHDGHTYAVTLGLDPANGCIREVFGHGAKVGSAMDAILDDACVALSLLLQYGVEPAQLARSMGRLGDGVSPASIIGALADLAACLAAEGAAP